MVFPEMLNHFIHTLPVIVVVLDYLLFVQQNEFEFKYSIGVISLYIFVIILFQIGKGRAIYPFLSGFTIFHYFVFWVVCSLSLFVVSVVLNKLLFRKLNKII
jgi:hypothetical protein